ncbi:MAG: F0F1 ATP synthase subunit B [Gemmatales bacterium]|nr:F0F1 ATP synthase subunit B [Gemmatales bacterium]MCS7161597.1 F0F1 ATP synthase subunit B [Gemmatales bacterium]MDW8176800.1 F0F1 ATP synthase subunit B [Gemmatales bacterium]MDW8221779.1 F0F1 ATP synthase subunit B [Gemmatales bacterium]
MQGLRLGTIFQGKGFAALFWALGITLLLGYYSVAPLWAAAVPAHGAASAEHGHGGGDEGPLSFSLDLAVWSLVVFGLLLVVLSRLAWRPMLEGLKQREENIHRALAEAEQARAEAQRIREQLQQEMQRCGEKVREILDEARRDAERTAEEIRARGLAEVQAERERLMRELARARDQALQQIWHEAVRLAVLISEKAIRRSLSEDDHRRLLDEALAELRQHGERYEREHAVLVGNFQP